MKERTETQAETKGICITPEMITEFLESMAKKGRSKGSLESYGRALQSLYEYLPHEKIIAEETGEIWRKWMLEEQNFSQRTANMRISVFNSFLQHLGKRQWQTAQFSQAADKQTIDRMQPELTRAEYLRLLSAAKRAEREKSYLIIKVLGSAGIRVQELPQLTVEAVEQGSAVFSSHNGMRQRLVHIPRVLQRELNAYIDREHIRKGPVFAAEDGTPLTRTAVYHYVNSVSQDAGVEQKKVNPRCLLKMYDSTRQEIEVTIQILIEQSYESLLEQEQIAIGWESSW